LDEADVFASGGNKAIPVSLCINLTHLFLKRSFSYGSKE
jgi:hypothetical protein